MQDDPFLKAAQACFDLAQNYLRKPLLRDISKPDLSVHYQAVCEIVCFLLHLSDRLIFEAAPKSRQFRMDKLVLASLNVFVKEIQDRVPLRNVTQPTDPVDYGANNRIVTREQADAARARIIEAINTEAIESAKAEASELFRNLYFERMGNIPKLATTGSA